MNEVEFCALRISDDLWFAALWIIPRLAGWRWRRRLATRVIIRTERTCYCVVDAEVLAADGRTKTVRSPEQLEFGVDNPQAQHFK